LEEKSKFALNQCEAIVQDGFDSLYKTLRALEVIDSMKLYQDDYLSMEQYMQSKWKNKQEMFSMIEKIKTHKI